MPRGRQTKSEMMFGKDEARLLLQQLISTGIVSSRDVAGARRALNAEAEALDARLSELRAAFEGQRSASPRKPVVPVPTAVLASELASERRQSKRRPLTPARKKIMQLQGRFLGYSHKIPKSEMVKFRKMIATKGKEATVAAMEKYVQTHGRW